MASFRNEDRLASVSVISHFVRPIEWARANLADAVSDWQTELRDITAPRPRVRMYEVHSSGLG